MELAGRRVLVTGASRGIGRALAERFAATGAHVLVNNAGGGAAGSIVDALAPDVWTVCQLNLLTPIELCRQAIPTGPHRAARPGERLPPHP